MYIYTTFLPKPLAAWVPVNTFNLSPRAPALGARGVPFFHSPDNSFPHALRGENPTVWGIGLWPWKIQLTTLGYGCPRIKVVLH